MEISSCLTGRTHRMCLYLISNNNSKLSDTFIICSVILWTWVRLKIASIRGFKTWVLNVYLVESVVDFRDFNLFCVTHDVSGAKSKGNNFFHRFGRQGLLYVRHWACETSTKCNIYHDIVNSNFLFWEDVQF